VACNNANKKKIKADRASREEVRKKAQRENKKRKVPRKSKKLRRYGNDTIEFCRRKQNKITNNNAKKESMSDKFNYKSNFYLHSSNNSSNRCKC